MTNPETADTLEPGYSPADVAEAIEDATAAVAFLRRAGATRALDLLAQLAAAGGEEGAGAG